jgi:hypothetical protein
MLATLLTGAALAVAGRPFTFRGLHEPDRHVDHHDDSDPSAERDDEHNVALQYPGAHWTPGHPRVHHEQHRPAGDGSACAAET